MTRPRSHGRRQPWHLNQSPHRELFPPGTEPLRVTRGESSEPALRGAPMAAVNALQLRVAPHLPSAGPPSCLLDQNDDFTLRTPRTTWGMLGSADEHWDFSALNLPASHAVGGAHLAFPQPECRRARIGESLGREPLLTHLQHTEGPQEACDCLINESVQIAPENWKTCISHQQALPCFIRINFPCSLPLPAKRK